MTDTGDTGGTPALEVIATGPLATVQDLGRRGHAALGVPRSGGFDRAALRAANRLVGNPDGAAALECTFGGLRVRALRAVTVAFTGAPCAGAPDWGRAVTLAAGSGVTLAPPVTGLRSYLAVRGGLAAHAELGSRSTDTLSGLGPAPLRAGDVLTADVAGGTPADGSWVPPAAVREHRVVLGPRADWFTPAAVAQLLDTPWRVRDHSDRVGVRLDGPRLQRAVTGELPSEATVPGALQVPPDGRPIVFGPDAPVTGGYPVIAVLADLDPVAQVRPGDAVRFTTRRGG